MKLYDKVPIEDWKKIAYAIQRLNISVGSSKEFYDNLDKLHDLLLELDDLNISLDFQERLPKIEEEIGLATLLQSIYDSNVDFDYKKANMYEKIQMLDELGVKNIRFNPIAFNNMSVTDAMSCSWMGINNIGFVINRCYTDGDFTLEGKRKKSLFDDFYHMDMKNITYADYILTSVIGLNIENKDLIEIFSNEAIIKNFDGKYPSKFEISIPDTPLIKVVEQTIDVYEDICVVEKLDTFDREDLGCIKRLTKTPKGQYYYKEFKNR